MSQVSDSNDLSSRLAALEDVVSKLQTDHDHLTKRYNYVKRINVKLTDDIEYMFDRLYYQDIKINEIQNYSCRENIEIHNISEHVLQSNLENYVIEIMASLTIKISSYGIVAVHRIGKKNPEKPRPVIVRFINRKNAYNVSQTCYKLKKVTNAEFHKFFITENLCSESRNIFNRLYKYKKVK